MNTHLPSVRSIFDHAVEIASDTDRRAYLDEACADATEIRAQVEALLDAHENAGSFLNEPPLGGQPTAEFEPIIERPGAVIGSYKLLEQIGEGGFGVVFLAEQQHPVRRKVALKVIKPGMDTRQVIARFEAERQALAVMDHPNIAKVLDAGTTDAGRPYFVMELVKGVPITLFCDERRLTLNERLHLFVTVCHAIQHAHQKGIIHRDIKPTNVLVALYDGVPVPKVIDFGVAKATAQDLTEKTMFTGFGQLIGTLEYMSPEQAQFNQLDIDTRSDIYSLGVLLYELLSGTTPFDQAHLRTITFDETLRIIREVEPPRPSTKISSCGKLATIATNRATQPLQLSRLVRGDLDWIAMTCLEKDRSRRYQTANGLAMDLRRYLGNEPVVARPPSSMYLLRKFVRRNRGPVLSAFLVLLALVCGIVGATWSKVEAQKRLAQNEKATDILAAVFRGVDAESAENEEVTLRAIMGQRMNEAAQQLEGDAVGDPLVVARLQHVLGVSLRDLGDWKQAETVLVKASRTRERLLGPNDLITAATKHDLAMLYRAQARYDLAEKLYKEAIAIRTAKLGADHPETLHSQQQLAMLYGSQGKLSMAESLCKEVLALRTAAFGADDPDTLTSKHRLALVYRSQGKFDLAQAVCQEVLDARTRNLGPNHLDTLASKQLLALLYRSQQKYALAETMYTDVLEGRSARIGPDHPDTLGTRHHLALLYWSMNRLDRSIPLLEETLRLRKARLIPDHPSILGTMADLGKNYCDAGRFVDAIPLFEEVQRKSRKPGVGDALLHAYMQVGKTTEAIAQANEKAKIARETFAADSAELATELADAGQALLNLKAYDAAEPVLLESYKKLRDSKDEVTGAAGGPLTQSVERLVQLYDEWGKADKAAQWRNKLGGSDKESDK